MNAAPSSPEKGLAAELTAADSSMDCGEETLEVSVLLNRAFNPRGKIII
jgi:hypothetical protein